MLSEKDLIYFGAIILYQNGTSTKEESIEAAKIIYKKVFGEDE